MTGRQQVDLDSMRINEREFDRMMRKALQIEPTDGKAARRRAAKKEAPVKGKPATK
jgi:hypothetical protein